MLLLPSGAAAEPRDLIDTLLNPAPQRPLAAASPHDPLGRMLLGANARAVAVRPALIRVATIATPLASSSSAPGPPIRLAAADDEAPPGARPSDARRDTLGDILLRGLGERPPSQGPPPPPGPVRNFPQPDPATLLLLMVQLDDLTLTDGMTAYGQPEDPLLPVGELSRLLELDVDVSPTEGRVTGRLGEARRALLIDLVNNIARIGPQQVQLAPGDVAVEPAEIYVRASVLAKLLPLRFAIDPRALSMKITALELLPIQGRLQRLARIRQAAPTPTTEVMRAREPYHLFTPPSFDVSADIGAQSQHPRLPSRYDIRMGGDLLYAGLQAYVGSDDSGKPVTGRVLLEKRSIDGDMLGPLHARTIGLGDVFTPGLALGPRSLGGRGIELSTVPLDQTSVFNRVDLRGDLPLGYDVELYVNDVLQAAQSQATRGQYEFLNVPLTQGVNVIRIVKYGPRGERTEETRVINANGGLLKPGQATFEFAAVEQDQSLIRFPGQDPLFADPGFGRRRIVANANYGLTQNLTATAGGAIYTDHLGVERNLGTLGLRTSLAGYAAQADIASDNRGGEGGDLSVAGRLLGANAVLRHAEYRGGLLDENNAEADVDRPVRRRTELTVDDNLTFGNRVIPLSFRAVRDAYADGGDAWIAQARGSASLGSILYSTGGEYDALTAANGQTTDRLRGFLGVSTFKNYRWQVRGNLDFDAVPDLRLSDLTITADRAITNRWSLRLGATQRWDAPKGLELIAGSTTKTKFGDLAITGQYDTVGNTWRLGAQLNFGVGYNPAYHGYELTRSGPGSGGSVNFHAFIDMNGDGVFDAGDRPAVGVLVEGVDQKIATDAEGRAYLTGFGSAPTARILVSVAESENPLVKGPPPVVEFTPRPGGVTAIEYPLRPTGEVMVNVKLRRPDAQQVGLSATRIRLVDGKGAAIEGVTEFDGSVNFTDVPAGTYQIQLDPEQAQRLRLRLAEPVSLTIKPDGSITPDVNVTVEFAPRTDAQAPG